MKKAIFYLFTLLLSLLVLPKALASLDEEKALLMDWPTTESGLERMINISICVNDKEYTAKLFNNEASAALVAKMPLMLTMRELNGNEKYYYFAKSFPVKSEMVDNVHAGDLMLYGCDCVVLFYSDFQTSYSYTRLGYIENPDGLPAALGAGEAQVSFALVKTGDEEGIRKQ